MVEYETSINCLRRLIQNDNSDEFDLLFKLSTDEQKKINIRTTINKARVISNKINEMYQVDPTISKYETTIQKQIFRASQDELGLELQPIATDLDFILKSTMGKINISKEQEKRINILLRLLGENNYDSNTIKIDNMSEAISYLSTEFHEEAIQYMSTNFKDIIDEGQIFNLNDEIIKEIIDLYFIEANNKYEENKKISNIKEEEEIFEKLDRKSDSGIVMHFLLQIPSEECTKEMVEYMTSHLTDDIILNEMSQIMKQFIGFLNGSSAHGKRSGVTSIEYEGDELKGIISHLKDKYGENLCEKGKIQISDIGVHHEVSGPISNLIKYDKDHINSFYRNNYGSRPYPTASEGWIEFDFLKRKVNLTSYTLRTSEYGFNSYYHAKSWRIVGSNDRESWEVVDQRVNNPSLNGKYKQCRFECSRSDKYYRYIRYIQDDSWYLQREHNIYLTCVEFFGSILSE